MKKTLHKIVMATVSLAIGGVGALYADDWRGWNTHPPEYPVSVAMDKFSELVSKGTNGRINPKTFHSAQLGQQDEAIQQIQVGAIQFAVFNAVPLNNIVKETQTVTLPYVFTSIDHMHKAMDGAVGDDISKALERVNMVGLAWYDSGARSFYSKKPLKSMADLKGLKIRVQSSDLFVDLVKALGANPTPIPYGEVYTSIQSGVIDGAENNWPSYESSNHYEVAKNLLLDEHTIVPEVFAINKQTWDKLSPADQKVVKDAARESANLQRQLWAKREKDSEAKVRAAGNVITQLADKSEFIHAMKPVYDKYAADPAIATLLKKIQAIK